MGKWLRIGCVVIALALPGRSVLSAQEAPAGGRLRVPPQPSQPSEPTVRQPAARPAIVATARLVTTDSRIDPARPTAGQEIRVLAVVQNQGAAASRELRFVVRCAEVRGGPSCPAKTFAGTLPGLEPGKRTRVVVDLGSGWAAGQYRLVTGTDVPQEGKTLALAILPAPSLARTDGGPARARTDEAPARTPPDGPQPGAERSLNPQPEPPSDDAQPRAGRRAAVRDENPSPAAPPERAQPAPSGTIPGREAPTRPQPGGLLVAPRPELPARVAANPTAPMVADGMGPAGGAISQPSGATPTLVAADLAFTKPIVDEGLVSGGTEATIYKSGLKLQLIWSSPYAAAYDWQWQVSLWPFPQNGSLTPPALLKDGDVPSNVFWIDFGSFPPLGTGPSTPMISSAGAPAGEIAMGGQPAAAPAGGGETIQAIETPPVSEKPPSGDLPPAIDEGDPPSGVAVAGPMEAAGANLGQQDQPTSIDAPMDVYIRLIPTKSGQPAGPPSNVVVAHYVPGPNPTEEEIKKYFEETAKKEKLLAEMTEKAKVYEVAILSWEPAVFEDPNKWGCVVVVQNPHADKFPHPLHGYDKGETVCPPKDPSKMEKSTGEKFLEGLEGYGKAWDGLGWAMDQAKQWVASKFAETACGWVGDDLKSDCESVTQQVAEAAISVGLVAAGVPPSIPSISELGQIAQGKVVEGAVDYTCDALEAEGVKCTPEMRAALTKMYQEALDQLQADLVKAAQEPGCGDLQTAKELGVLPLPCFNDFPGTVVKPATGAIDESPQVTVRMRRLKPDPDFPLACRMHVSLFLENHFPGGNVGGSFSSNYVPAGPIQGYPFKGGQAEIPSLAVGQSTVLTVSLGPKEPFFLPGNQWAPFQWSDWLALYRGGKGPLKASLRTTEAIAELPTGGYKTTLGCSEETQMDVQIPHQL